MGEGLKLLTDPINDWVWVTLLLLPRLLVIMQFWPVLVDTVQTQLLKNTAAMGLLLIPAWYLLPHVETFSLKNKSLALYALTEAAIGLVIGLALALPMYALKAFGALVEVLRGTTFSVLLNPSSGGEELTMERLAGMGFGLWLVLTPFWLKAFELVYETYLLIPPSQSMAGQLALSWAAIRDLFGNHLVWSLRYLAPVFVLVLLSEAVLYLISGYASSIQTYSVDAALKTLVCLWMLLMLSWYAPDSGIQLTEDISQSALNVLKGFVQHER